MDKGRSRGDFYFGFFAMLALRTLLRAYSRDQNGAYAVMLALMGGFIAVAANIGLSAYKVQNSATTAEQLIDIACQKLAYADPALYPTGNAAAAAAQQALDARLSADTHKNQGSFSVTAELINPDFVTPIHTDGINADLRRFEFTVSYRGKVSGIPDAIAPKGAADVAIAKKCRSICTGLTNVVYSNAAATGHWFDANTLKIAQFINNGGQAIDEFNDAIVSEMGSNPFPAGTRLVLTIISIQNKASEARIRYRELITLPAQIYVDSNTSIQKGEPSRKARRIVADEDDQIIVQFLNADGSLPGMCGFVDDPPCVGANCGVIGGQEPPQEPELVPVENTPCQFNVVFPIDRPFPTSMRWIDFSRVHVNFVYPKDGKFGKLTIWTVGGFQLKKALAPFYAPNLEPKTIEFKNSVVRTIPAEVASALAVTLMHRSSLFRYGRNKYLVHMSGIHWYYFWDGKDGCHAQKSPIVFDTENIGNIQTTFSDDSSGPTGPLFDYFGTGKKFEVEWPIGRGQAWLVDNRDGLAAEKMNGRRFFGDLDGHEDGYQKLRELDTSGTGILTGADLNGLALWFDNGNAIVEDGELKSLQDVGVTAVDTRAEWKDLPDGRAALRATAVLNGKTIMTEDLFVQISTKIDSTASRSVSPD